MRGDERETAGSRPKHAHTCVLWLAAIGFAIAMWQPGRQVIAQGPAGAGRGTIVGTVSADRGAVTALRVKATDTVHRIAYTVYTRTGKYQVSGLPAGEYKVEVVEEDFESPSKPVTVTAGAPVTVDLALTSKPRPPTNAELVDYDTLYPPDPARPILEKHCFGCHGPSGWHRRGNGYTESEWRQRVRRMFDQDAWSAGGDRGAGSDNAGIKAPPAQDHAMTDDEKEAIVKYLAKIFPPGRPPRDWKLDPLVRDEAALSQAMFVEYEVPLAPGPDFSDARPSAISPFLWPSAVKPGLIWLGGFGNGSIVAVDTRNPDYATRAKEWRIPYEDNKNPRPHVVQEFKGRVYYAGLGDDAVGEVDSESGQLLGRYPAPHAGGGAHTLRIDSKGNVWFTTVYGYSRINRVDAVTKKVTEYDPVNGANWYGLLADKQDRIWAVGYGAFFGIAMYDPKTDKWTTYPTTASNRRLTMDPGGNVWANQYFGNKLARLDTKTGKVTEYPLPLKYGNPYESWSDRDGNIWIENAVYNSIIRFDPRTEKFTYYPFPRLRSHSTKFELDQDGVLWYSLFSFQNRVVTKFLPRGNVRASS